MTRGWRAARRSRGRARSLRPARRLDHARRRAASRRRQRPLCTTPDGPSALPRPRSLADWLRADRARRCHVQAAIVERLLAGVASGSDANDRRRSLGRARRPFPPRRAGGRLEQAAGGLRRPCRPRGGARAQRLAEIGAAPGAAGRRKRGRGCSAVRTAGADRRQAEDEWRSAPADEALRNAHLAHRSLRAANSRPPATRLAQAETQCRDAEQAAACRTRALAARRRRPAPAAGSRCAAPDRSCAAGFQRRAVPAGAGGAGIAACAARVAAAALARRRGAGTTGGARRTARQRPHRSRGSPARVSRCCARPSAPRSTNCSGNWPKPRQAVEAADAAQVRPPKRCRLAGEARAVAAEQGRGRLKARSTQRSEARATAVARLQHFAATGLLSSALPEHRSARPARRLDHRPGADPRAPHRAGARPSIKDDEDAWTRVQRQIAEDLPSCSAH